MNIKRILISGAAGAVLLSAAFIPAFANNGPSNHNQKNDDWRVNNTPIGNNGYKNASLYNPGNELSNSQCTTPTTGKPIINVSQKVQNDADSAVGGTYWAFDYFTRQITVWGTGTTGTYCAVVTYNGNFYAVPGQINPEDELNSANQGIEINSPMDEPVNGPFSGGYRAIINGTLSTTPAWSTHGTVPTTNYQCDLTDNCPGEVDWVAQYFPGYTGFNQEWWGWKYDGGSHGTWINASTGNLQEPSCKNLTSV